MASPALPFYFAWVDGSETTFGPEHEVFDEEIISFNLQHEEGQFPTLEIAIKNPRIGLLNPGRKVWAWLSWTNPSNSHVEPLFFGVLVGIPDNMFGEVITLKLVAQSQTYIEDRQAVAEAMKVRPYYDPVFIDEKHRDNPDSILEGWSSLWHIDRLTLETTASDILEGEDGLVTFSEDEVLYDSVKHHIGQPPLTIVQVKGSVNWSQRQSGYVQFPVKSFKTYTGGSIMQDWPKPGHGLGSGWRVSASFVQDTYAIEQTPTINGSGEWTNSSVNKLQCTPEKSTMNVTYPALLSDNAIQAILTDHQQTGVCDPFSDPPINRPASIQVTGIVVPLWYISGQMKLRYDARRERYEEITLTVVADTQAVLTSPTVEQHTETITIQGADVGQPLIEVLAWSDFTNAPVQLGQIIFPNDPTTVGGTSYQICVQAGTTGTVQPTFSDIVGAVTIDGTVHWASMGGTPLLTQPDWTPASDVPLGEIICFSQQTFNPATSSFEEVPNSTSYYICTGAGRTNSSFTFLTYTIPPFSNDTVPVPNQIYTYIARPTFSTTVGATISDGTVTWTVLGAAPSLLGIPIGGTAANVPARCYFPTDRGLWSVEHLICLARARLRHRARAVTVSCQVPFVAATVLSCRKNATIHDPRLPGGEATGKVTSYSLKCDGTTGEFIGEVTIGCAVGRDGHSSAVEGVGVYAAPGYMNPGYQIMAGAEYSFPLDDISYTPPVFAPSDDGLVFPLTRAQIVLSEQINGSWEAQGDAIRAAIPASVNLLNLANPDTVIGENASNQTLTDLSPMADGAWAEVTAQRYWTARAIPATMEANPVWYQLVLKPVQNGPFGAEYLVSTTPLKIPMGIDLEAPSSP